MKTLATGPVFYVYEHWRPDRNECFYVGKGFGNRANDMYRGRNRHHQFVREKLTRLGFAVEVRIVESGFFEEDAFAFEKERIAFWRADGADLVNMSEGGEGPSGKRHTEEHKRHLSVIMKGRKATPEARARMSIAAMGNQKGLGTKKTPEAIEKTARAHRGAKRSDETRQRMSVARRGVPLGPPSPEHRAKISAAQIGRPKSEEHKALMREGWRNKKLQRTELSFMSLEDLMGED